MKRYILLICVLVALLFGAYGAVYRLGLSPLSRAGGPVDVFIRTEGREILLRQEDGTFRPFEIRGVCLGSGLPGAWSVDYAIDRETYLRWFALMQEMGANTVRVYTIHHAAFYDALWSYNTERERAGEDPLWLINGVWVNDYIQNSHRGAYDPEFLDTFLQDCRTLVDVIHGKRNISLGYQGVGSGIYRRDVSKWVLGYILGVEWETSLVVYTDQADRNRNSFSGEYLRTAADATPFEAMLALAGDSIISYETRRYGQQRLVSFANWPNTDPFSYPLPVAYSRDKVACVNVERIEAAEAYQSGLFASYHVYPFYPDFVDLVLEAEQIPEEEVLLRFGKLQKETLEYRLSKLNVPSILTWLDRSALRDDRGRLNTYRAYLRTLARFHAIPVVISEYGITTGRGMVQEERHTGRNKGYMTEEEQGRAIIDCYEDIRSSGCAGSCLFSWQDEWFRRAWNTLYAIDRDKNAYWSDVQTNEQFFGVLTFDPGKEKSVCCVDGDTSEWTERDLVSQNGDLSVSMKYDEKFVYFLVQGEDLDPETGTVFLPIDTCPKVGAAYCADRNLTFARPADFLLVLHGRNDSRLLVQERYEVLRSTFHREFYAVNPYFEENTPPRESPVFRQIYMVLMDTPLLPGTPEEENLPTAIFRESGKLRYGDACPDSTNFDSLADFFFAGDSAEIRIPWQLLNFSSPPERMIHDDYYERYGIENLKIEEMYVGPGHPGEGRIPMDPFSLKGWGRKVTYHERLKRSYHMLKEYWNGLS